MDMIEGIHCEHVVVLVDGSAQQKLFEMVTDGGGEQEGFFPLKVPAGQQVALVVG